MTDATHTRESDLDGRLQRILFDVHRKCKSDTISNIIEYANDEIKAAMRKAYELDRTSTPIPLTPSDEMVEAACRGYIDSKYPTFKRHGPANIQSDLDHMRAALQAALNLMGGKK